LRAELTTQAQVANLKISIIIDEDVGGLQVSVHDPFAMHMLQRTRNLMDVAPHLFLRKADFFLLCSLHYHLKITFFGPLDGNEEFVQLIVDEPAQILHDVRVI
jgi:hypothetical protein